VMRMWLQPDGILSSVLQLTISQGHDCLVKRTARHSSNLYRLRALHFLVLAIDFYDSRSESLPKSKPVLYPICTVYYTGTDQRCMITEVDSRFMHSLRTATVIIEYLRLRRNILLGQAIEPDSLDQAAAKVRLENVLAAVVCELKCVDELKANVAGKSS